MKIATRNRLDELSNMAGKEYGKLVQKLLAIALLEAGAERLVESAIQGIDLQFQFAGEAYACEVKTTTDSTIKLGKKDLDGLTNRVEAGADAYIAVLGGHLLDEWLFVRFRVGELAAAREYSVLELRAYRSPELEARVQQHFDVAVERHFGDACTINPQSALDLLLQKYPEWKLP